MSTEELKGVATDSGCSQTHACMHAVLACAFLQHMHHACTQSSWPNRMPSAHVGASTFAALRTRPAGLLLPLLLLLLLLPDWACAAADRLLPLLLLLLMGCLVGHQATAGPVFDKGERSTCAYHAWQQAAQQPVYECCAGWCTGCCMHGCRLPLHANCTHLAPPPCAAACNPCCMALARGHSSASTADASLLLCVCVWCLLLLLVVDAGTSVEKHPRNCCWCCALSICGHRGLHARLRRRKVSEE